MCWLCYYTPEIRCLYPSVASKFSKRGPGNKSGLGIIPAEPCPFLPGTAGKIKIMQERAEKGETLFHPRDKKFDLN